MTEKKQAVISCRSLWKVFGDNPETCFNDGVANISKMHKKGLVPAVKDINLDIYSGEMLVVMGLSGSGKSTLIRCLSRLVESTSGSVIIDGEDILAMSEKELIKLRRSKMGMVFQSFGLLPHRTVLDNVAFPLEMRGQDKFERIERALEVIKLVGLAGREEHFPRELSGGQQQRVGIARSLAIEPDIWFLDEPFSALDPLIRREMQDEFLRLQDLLGKTIVFITHDFDEALRLADRIAIMYEGRIEQIGTPDEIVMNPATEYVAKFTRGISRSKVVKVKSLMTQLGSSDTEVNMDSSAGISGDASIASIARCLISGNETMIPVVDESHNVIGVLDKQKALDVLLDEALE